MWVWPFDEDISAGFVPAFLLAPQLMGSVPWTPAGIKIIPCYGVWNEGLWLMCLVSSTPWAWPCCLALCRLSNPSPVVGARGGAGVSQAVSGDIEVAAELLAVNPSCTPRDGLGKKLSLWLRSGWNRKNCF